MSPRNESELVWDLADPPALARDRKRSESVDHCKRRILDTLLEATEPVFIAHPDDPAGEIPGDWRPVADGTWNLPRGLDLDHPNVQHWLHSLGNWAVQSWVVAVAPLA